MGASQGSAGGGGGGGGGDGAAPTRYGEAEDGGRLMGAYLDRGEEGRGASVLGVSRAHMDQHNAGTGDRRMRVRVYSTVLCAAFSSRGGGRNAVIATGSEAGDMVMYDAGTLGYARTVRTNGDDASAALGATDGGDVDVYAAPPPSSNQTTAVAFLGRNIVAAGHSDGVVRAYRVDTLELAQVIFYCVSRVHMSRICVCC